jgi:hypothetical protein
MQFWCNRPGAKDDLPTGTELRNITLISFDEQTVIATNQINPLDASAGTDPNKEALNTIDADGPNSFVLSLPETVPAGDLQVDWSGTDLGSGVSFFDIFVSVDAGPYTRPGLAAPAQSPASFQPRRTTPTRFAVSRLTMSVTSNLRP